MSSASIRPAAVAGLFYPSNTLELQQQVQQYLTRNDIPQTPAPLAIVTPHAGYVYSGATAGVAWASVAARAESIYRVVLLGPSHRVALRGVATSTADYWQTPLGRIGLDKDAAEHLQLLPFVIASDKAHAREHSLEVQVPFIQTVFANATLLPLVVGDATPEQIASLLKPYWEDPHSLIAVSSDLSHYHDYRTAQQLDRQTSDAIEHFDIQAIGPEQACGCRPLCGLLKLAAEARCRITTLDLCNSGDTAGDRQRVVGYGAYVVQ